MSLTSVLTLPMNHEIFEWFKHKQMFLPRTKVPYEPDVLIGSATVRPKEGLLVSNAYFQLWPSVLLIKGAKIYTFWSLDKTVCHIWIGDNLFLDYLWHENNAISYTLNAILKRYTKTERTKEDAMFLGYLCSQHDSKQNAFGILYAIPVTRSKLINNNYLTGKWMSIADLKKVYRKLEPWSKRIFDYIYEHPPIRKRLKLYQKNV